MHERLAVGSLESPIGVLWAACTERGVCRVIFPREAEQKSLERWIAQQMPDADRVPGSLLLAQTCRELDEYFAGARRDFTLPVDLRGNRFQQQVWSALTRIPFGRTVSYGVIAREVEAPQAARAVGAACGANPVPIIVP